MKECLSSLGVAGKVSFTAVLFYLRYMSAHGDPSSYLPVIIRATTTHIVPTVPLKPPSRIVFIYPTFLAPHREWLASIYTKKVKFRIVRIATLLLKLCFDKPIFGKLFYTISHIYATKNSKREHLFGSQIWLETWIEMFACRFAQSVLIPILHFVAHTNYFYFH